MRVLLFTDLYPESSARKGGDQTQAVKHLYQNLSKFRISLVAVVRLQQVFRKRMSFRWLLPRKAAEIYDIPVYGFREYFFEYLTKRVLERELKNEDYDVLVCHLSLCALQIKKLGIAGNKPRILVVHRSDLNYDYLSKCIDYFDLVCARSYAIKRELEVRFNLVDVPVIYSGIPSYFYDIRKQKKYRIIEEGKLSIVYAGELKKLKNVDSVITAIPTLIDAGIDVKFDIFGVGPEESNLRSLVENLGLDEVVSFHGWIDRNELPYNLSTSDVFVMPSKPETFGLVYLEAMATGLIILGHRGEGIDGIVEDCVNGLMVKKACPIEVAEKLLWFYHLSAADKESMRLAARELARNYNETAASKNLAEILRSVI